MKYSANNVESSEFLERVKNILLDILSVDDIGMDISMDTELVSSLGENSIPLSSIDYVDFLVCVENAYDVIFEYEARFYTLQDVYDYILMKHKQLEENANE